MFRRIRVYTKHLLVHKIYFCKMFSKTKSLKLCGSKIWRYMRISILYIQGNVSFTEEGIRALSRLRIQQYRKGTCDSGKINNCFFTSLCC